LPIFITENGIADSSDELRQQFLPRIMYVINKALRDGYNVIGYSYWSFMDNWEWGTFDIKYGLLCVDFETGTLERTWRPSAYYYQKVIKEIKGKKPHDI
jgi:beta-glucosidase/6-phospho-beta-glucosidase/beta-galactosidase